MRQPVAIIWDITYFTMNYTVTQHSGKAVEYFLEGEVSACQAAMDLMDDISLRMRKGFQQFVLNFSRTTYVNSSGVQALIKIHRSIARSGGSLVLSGIPESLEPIFSQVGLLDQIPHIKNRERMAVKMADT